MAEFEELRLTVSLVDNASTGLARLKREMQTFSTETSQRYNRSQEETARKVKEAAGAHENLYKTIQQSIRGITSTIGSVTALGYAIYNQYSQITKFAEEIRKVSHSANLLGTSMGNLRNITQQTAAMGISAETTARAMEGMQRISSQFITVWGKAEFRENITKSMEQFRLAPGEINKYIAALSSAKTEGQRLIVARDYALRLEKEVLRVTGDAAAAALARSQFLTGQGLPAEVALLKQIRELTEDQKKIAADLTERSDQWTQKTGQVAINMTRISDIFKLEAMGPNSLMSQGLNAAVLASNTLADNLERAYRAVKTPLPSGSWWNQLNPWNQNMIQREQEALGAIDPSKAPPATFDERFGGARASGGPVKAGQRYLVGERGPEMFTPSTGGDILANINEDRRNKLMEEQTVQMMNLTDELKRINDALLGKRGGGGGGGGGDLAAQLGIGSIGGGGGDTRFPGGGSGPGLGSGGGGGGFAGFGGGAGGGAAGGVAGHAGGQGGIAGIGGLAGISAAQAGVQPKFPTGPANVGGLDAEFVTRLNKAWDDMNPEQRASWNMAFKSSGHRTREDQERIWRESGGGTRYAAAPPGHSRHEGGAAVDIQRGAALNFLQTQGHKYGLTGILGGLGGRDPVHIQMAAGFQNLFQGGAQQGIQAGTANVGPGGNAALAQARQAAVGAELQNPQIQQLLMASAAAEVGTSNPGAIQAYMESVTNRAAATRTPLANLLTNRDAAGNFKRYYPGTTTSKLGRQFAGPLFQQMSSIISNVMGGSNVARLATGNESGSVRSGGAPIVAAAGGERFVIENWTKAWAQNMATQMAQAGYRGAAQAFQQMTPAMQVAAANASVARGQATAAQQQSQNAIDAAQQAGGGGYPTDASGKRIWPSQQGREQEQAIKQATALSEEQRLQADIRRLERATGETRTYARSGRRSGVGGEAAPLGGARPPYVPLPRRDPRGGGIGPRSRDGTGGEAAPIGGARDPRTPLQRKQAELEREREALRQLREAREQKAVQDIDEAVKNTQRERSILTGRGQDEDNESGIEKQNERERLHEQTRERTKAQTGVDIGPRKTGPKDQSRFDDTDRKSFDKDGSSVAVKGNLNATVTVKAPKGTTADAKGDGVIKKTSVVRQHQMDPAQSSTNEEE